jgi:hypothetical protein
MTGSLLAVQLCSTLTSLKLTKKELSAKLMTHHMMERQKVRSWLGAMTEHRCSTCSRTRQPGQTQPHLSIFACCKHIVCSGTAMEDVVVHDQRRHVCSIAIY